ncbi:MAG: hypothetical protein IJ899_08115 [Blautia sp.]|nr:hypothetical protein [Blautia sp.]
MTREELLEDVKQGDLVKIYTGSNEVFEGTVLDFGASGLKINISGTTKSKRIMYERITEYDVEDGSEALDSGKDESGQEINIIRISKEPTETVTEEQVLYKETTEVKAHEIIVDRSSLFVDCEERISFEEISKFWETLLDKWQKQEIDRVKNIVSYAKKVNEFRADTDRIRRAFGEYKKLAANDRIYNVFIGTLFHELNRFNDAIEYYYMGGAYDAAFLVSYFYKIDSNLLDTAILATRYNRENGVIIRWLCDYAVANNDFSIISHLVQNSLNYIKDILFYWYSDKEEMKSLPNKAEVYSEENIEYLKKACKDTASSMGIIEEVLRPVQTEQPGEVVQEVEEEETLKGIVSYYKKDGGYGSIKNVSGGQIYFYIRQVRDIDLQRILATEVNYKRRVTYKRGINFKGEIAADAIELDHEYDEPVVEEYQYTGFLDDYDFDKGWGKIRSGNKAFNFIFEEIKDPLLYAEMSSRPYSVIDLEVKFNAKDHQSKSTHKKTKVAIDIVGKKQYTEFEISDFIRQKLVTKKEVDEWLGIREQKNTGVFREVIYEPLEPIGKQIDTTSPEKQLLASVALDRTGFALRQEEKKAVALLLTDKLVNPFSSLRKNANGQKPFQEAHRYMVGRKNPNGDIIGVDLEKAEQLFIKAIESSDQTASAVANLVNIYIKFGGEYIVKGLQLLEAYGYLFPSDKLTNMRIQLIDKSGNFEALELILRSAIPNCIKKNTVWQYMAKLAGIYYKQEKWDLAIEWFNKSLEYLDNNKNVFSQYIKLRNGNLRSLIIAIYSSGDKKNAIILAKGYIKGSPEDPVVTSIIEGTFDTVETKEVLGDLGEVGLQYEDDFLDLGSNELSQYLIWKLHVVDLSSTFSKVSIVYEKLKNGVYSGSAEDSNKAVKYINDNLLRKNKRGINSEYRSAISIGIARILSDSRENTNLAGNGKVSIDEVKQYLARYARYSADVLVEKYATIDSIRFLYIQALKYLGAKDDGNIIASINMLIGSFFVDSKHLTDELHEMKSHVYKDTYYQMACVSVKDFLIATFMLQERQEHVTNVLGKAYAVMKLRQQMVERLNIMTGESKTITEYYDFDALWKRAKGLYYSNIEQLGKEIAYSINEYHMAGSIRQHVYRIKEVLDAKMLWNQDELILDNYLKLIMLIANTFEKYTVEEKIEGFRQAESGIIKLKTDIETAPTEFGFDYVYTKLGDLSASIRERFDELYFSSQPECDIFLSNDSVYVNENSVEIAITFKNAEDKQDADAVEIELEGSKGASFVKCEKKFTNIRSGEEQDYMAVFSLDEAVVLDGQFEVKVTIQYRYRESVDSIKTTSIVEILPVNISDKKNFKPIENKYNLIIRSSGVDIRTPELFKGRNALIDSICASMSSDGVMTKNRGIILWGQRRVGKNSVKDYLKEKIKEEYPGAYLIIELGSIGKCRNLREVLITIINKTEDTLMTEYEDVYEKLISLGMRFNGYALENIDNYMPEFSRFMDRFSTRLRKIGGSENNIPLYFIDEFSYLYEWIEKGEINGKEFMRFWKSFIQDFGICSIIIAQDNIPVWKSRYENEFACMNYDNEITYLDFEGAKELICEPCQIEGRVLFAPDAVKLIYNWTKGSAYLIVIFCKHIIDYLNENYTEKATKTIVQIVFEKEFLDKKEMFMSDDFEPQIQDVANVGDEGTLINKLNETLLKEIASQTITSSQVKLENLKFFEEQEPMLAKKVLDRLKDRKIIEIERDTYCSINMPLLKFYLLREQSLLTKESLGAMTR